MSKIGLVNFWTELRRHSPRIYQQPQGTSPRPPVGVLLNVHAEKMPGFLSRATSDSRIQLVATAILSGGLVAAGLLSYQRLSHEKRVSRLKDSIPHPSDDHPPQKVSIPTTPRELPPLDPAQEELITDSLPFAPSSSPASAPSPPPTRKTCEPRPWRGARRPATSTTS